MSPMKTAAGIFWQFYSIPTAGTLVFIHKEESKESTICTSGNTLKKQCFLPKSKQKLQDPGWRPEASVEQLEAIYHQSAAKKISMS